MNLLLYVVRHTRRHTIGRIFVKGHEDFFTPYSRAGRVNVIRAASFRHPAIKNGFWRDPSKRAEAILAERYAQSVMQ